MPEPKPYPVFLEAATALLFGVILTMSSLYQVRTANLSALQPVLVGLITAGGALLSIAATELVRRLDTTRSNAIARMLMVDSTMTVVVLIRFAQASSLVLGVGTIENLASDTDEKLASIEAAMD